MHTIFENFNLLVALAEKLLKRILRTCFQENLFVMFLNFL